MTRTTATMRLSAILMSIVPAATAVPALAVEQDAPAGPLPPPSASSTAAADAAPETEAEVHQRRMFEYLQHPGRRPVRSLLVEQEMPLIGVHWGAHVQLDLPLNDEPAGAEPTLRTAQLVFYRGFGPDWSAKVTANYDSAGQFEIGDSYTVYSGWKSLKATAGFFRPAYSLESTSKRVGLTFMERSLPVNALSEKRGAGISVTRRTTNAIVDAGVILASPSDEGLREEGQAVILRYVHAPLDSNKGPSIFRGRDIWAGLSVSYRINADAANTRFRSTPEVNVADDYFVDTGTIDGADRILRVGFEASKVAGLFSWQAELLTTRVYRDNAPDVRFLGGYLYASWFLTGESRNYDSASGAFLGVSPNKPVWHGGWGAWELGLRVSTVDLNDEDIVGGRQRNFSLGLNWYLDERFRVQLNLIRVLDVYRPGNEFDGEDPWIAALRLQWYLK